MGRANPWPRGPAKDYVDEQVHDAFTFAVESTRHTGLKQPAQKKTVTPKSHRGGPLKLSFTRGVPLRTFEPTTSYPRGVNFR